MGVRKNQALLCVVKPFGLMLLYSFSAMAAVLEVPTAFPTIQGALDVAQPGDTVRVRAGTYQEKLHFPRSGSPGSFITLEAASGETVILDGTGVEGANMILVESKSYVRVRGLEIRNNLGVRDGSGIRVIGSGSGIEILNNRIHDIRGKNAMGITVYGTEPTPISDLVIVGNEIFHCEPAPSEALTLNGNVTNFEVRENFVHDVNNIGIDFIGGETDIQPDPSLVARNGVCRGNRVERARSVLGGGFAAGIYVDGGKNIVLENNIVRECDLGIEVGAENSGIVATGIVVRNNIVAFNEKAGLVLGGYDASVGRVQNCLFENNTLYHNDTLWRGFGELWLQWSSSNVVRNNLVVAGAQGLLLYAMPGGLGNTLDYNLWFVAGAATSRWVWGEDELFHLASYQALSGQDNHSLFADPGLRAPVAGDFHLEPSSAAIDAGDPTTIVDPSDLDLDSAPRLSGSRVDMGADEFTCGNGVIDAGEVCDDGNVVDCDGCDHTCTPSSTCGNGVMCPPEQCDDGNTEGGDCCSATCTFEPAGSSCSDGNLCTHADTCDGSGLCVGTVGPLPGCRAPSTLKGSSLRLVDASRPANDRLGWVWHGGSTALADFGSPTTTTEYALCVFAYTGGVPNLVIDARIDAGNMCAGKPCWRAMRNGYVYRHRWGNAAGVQAVSLRTSATGTARLRLRARGVKFPLPPLPLAQDPQVVVELRNSFGQCWGATMLAPARRSDSTGFFDTSD